jgi:hypothetical protein
MQKYFVYDGQAKKGPFTLEELKGQSIKKETLVWYEGLKEWESAGHIEELNDFFIQKITPPPLPKTLDINIPSRDKILGSFTDASEKYPEPVKKSKLFPVAITIIIIAGLIAGVIFFRKYF